MKESKMNVQLLLEARRRILTYPENYDQQKFCGTVCCIAGHIVMAADGQFPVTGDVGRRADELIGVDTLALFGTGNAWRNGYDRALSAASTLEERAIVAADAILDFIITEGWTQKADLDRLPELIRQSEEEEAVHV